MDRKPRKFLNEDSYAEVRKDLVAGKPSSVVAKTHGISLRVAYNVNSSLDWDDYLCRFRPKRWEKLQEKTRVGRYTVPDGKEREVNSKIMRRIPLVEKRSPVELNTLSESAYKEIKEMLGVGLSVKEISETYFVAEQVVERVRESLDYKDWEALSTKSAKQGISQRKANTLGRVVTKEICDAVLAGRKAGLSKDDLITKYSMGDSTISRILASKSWERYCEKKKRYAMARNKKRASERQAKKEVGVEVEEKVVSPSSKPYPITPEQYGQIKSEYLMGGKTSQEVGDKYGFCRTTVSRIVNSEDYEDYRAKIRRRNKNRGNKRKEHMAELSKKNNMNDIFGEKIADEISKILEAVSRQNNWMFGVDRKAVKEVSQSLGYDKDLVRGLWNLQIKVTNEVISKLIIGEES